MTSLNVPSARQTKAVRSWLGLSQTDFAENCGINLSTLMDYEKGNRKTSTETLTAIALYVMKLKGVRFDRAAIVLPE